MNYRQRIRTALIAASYALVAVLVCMALGRFAARMTGRQLLGTAQQALARVQAHQPLWLWRLREPHDLIASRAFGKAKIGKQNGALEVISVDGTPFELGLPVAWALDLRHWPVLQVKLSSSAAGVLGLVWQGDHTPACVATAAGSFTSSTRALRLDLRRLAWASNEPSSCAELGIATMLRLRVQIPAKATLHLFSARLLADEPVAVLPNAQVDLHAVTATQDIQRLAADSANWAMPLFRLPPHIRAETMLALRDELRARWPAALIIPADTTMQAAPAAPFRCPFWWVACAIYWLILAWLVWHPLGGAWCPWVEIAGCLLGPLWLIAGLHWGLRPTALGSLAFVGGLVYALLIERRHLSCLWHWPLQRGGWLWPLIALPVTLLLILSAGHPFYALKPVHMFTYAAWAWLQQWLMLRVLLPRFEQILGGRSLWAIMPTALVFALLHTPNGVLMQLCFIGELWWAWCFLQSRSVLPVTLAHASCALLIESALTGGALLRSLEVSARFFL